MAQTLGKLHDPLSQFGFVSSHPSTAVPIPIFRGAPKGGAVRMQQGSSLRGGVGRLYLIRQAQDMLVARRT